jgi:hypothetical protein
MPFTNGRGPSLGGQCPTPSSIRLDYHHAIRAGLPAMPGELGSAYAIPIIYVPLLTITHFVAIYWLARPRPKAGRSLAIRILDKISRQ